MDLYIIRHAEAVEKADNQSDADRPLTPAGEAQALAIATGLQRRGVPLQLILASPLLRARQTAEGMVKGWSGHPPEVEICEQLAPGSRARKLAKVLLGLEQKSVAIVGHEPDLSRWTAWLIGSRKAQLTFAKAGMAHVYCPEPVGKATGTLKQLVTPGWFS